MTQKIKYNGYIFDHPTIMANGTIQLVIQGDYYEFTMAEILQETQNNSDPEDWDRDKEQLHDFFDQLAQDIAE